MKLNPDFEDLLIELADAGARFAVVGGYAIIGREALIINKRASARPRDLLDVETLTSA